MIRLDRRVKTEGKITIFILYASLSFIMLRYCYEATISPHRIAGSAGIDG